MTTSCLYHTQGIRGYQYKKTERSGDTEVYYLHSTLKQLNCPCCESRETSMVQTGKTRDIRGLCIGLKQRGLPQNPWVERGSMLSGRQDLLDD